MKIIVKKLGNMDADITAYLHDKSSELLTAAIRPAILILPGGGYVNCSDREAEPIALAYAAEGYNAFVLRYSVGKTAKYSDAYDDAQSAMTLLYQQADEWQIDKNKIAVIGFSAGGHLAAMLGTTGVIRPNALILCYPCITIETSRILGKHLPSADEYVDAKTPPTFIFSTRDDQIVSIRNTLSFANALEKAERPFELHIFRHGSHGLSLAKPLTASGFRGMSEPRVASWLNMSILWLKEELGDFATEYDMPK